MAAECYSKPNLMYGQKAWTISRQLQKKLNAKKSNKTMLREAHTARSLLNRIRKHQVTLFGHVMRREKLEHLIKTGMIEGKRSRGKHREKMLYGLTNCLKVRRVTEVRKATRNIDVWKIMIASTNEHSNWIDTLFSNRSELEKHLITF